jgi:hypothetical protein
VTNRFRLACFASIVALLWLAPAVATGPAAGTVPAWHFTDVSRVVAVGDVHGAYDALVATLEALEVVDEDVAWAGGTTHFVSLGDVPDRGPESRRVFDLLMRLEAEAAAAGGAVHLVLGNHEVMNLIGDLRYVAREEFTAFADDESSEEREAAFEGYVARRPGKKIGRKKARREFDGRYPPGFFAHRRAFSPDGAYGAWLLDRPTVIVVDDTAFVHGGLPPVVAELGAEELNRRVDAQLRAYLDALETVVEAGVVPVEASLAERKQMLAGALEANPEAPWKEAAESVLDVTGLLAHNDSGPLWYRRTAGAPEDDEAATVDAALERLGVARAVHGHSVTADHRIRTRFDGKVLLIDTGMLASVYEGRPAALVIEGETIRAYYTEEDRFETISPDPVEARSEPAVAGTAAAALQEADEAGAGMSDADAERFLATAEIVEIESLGTGVTKPKRVTLRADGRTRRAVFKSVDETPPSARNLMQRIQQSDRYQYELAAYRLDRLLGLGMVPPTAIREIDGKEGVLQLWVEGGVNELERVQRNLRPSDRDAFDLQVERMHLFDVLIHNTDRNQGNLLYTPVDERVHLIDHTRAFRVNNGRPASAREAVFRPDPALEAALEALDRDGLREALGDLIEPVQIKALLKRRDGVLEDMRARLAAAAAN